MRGWRSSTMSPDIETDADGSEAGRVSTSFMRATEANLLHVHVERENNVAKIWLNPLRLAHSGDFGRAEIRRIEQIVAEHREQFLEAWNDFFAD